MASFSTIRTACAIWDRPDSLSSGTTVAEAHGGMTALSRKTKLNRESLYKMLSENGNPDIRSILILLQAMGLRLSMEPQTRRAKSSKVKEVS